MNWLLFWVGGALAALAITLPIPTATAADLQPPGKRPLAAGVHALTGGRVITRPGEEIQDAVILIRDGRIQAVGSPVDVMLPDEARVHDMTGLVICAGWIDAHVTPSGSSARATAGDSEETAADHLTAGAGAGFLGAPTATGDSTPGTMVTPGRRMAHEYAPSASLLESLRQEGFTAANIVPDRGVIRGTSTLVALGSTDRDIAILRPEVFQHISLDTRHSPSSGDGSSRPRSYPASLMGVVAVIRQTFFDAQFQQADRAFDREHGGHGPRPAWSASLEALQPALSKKTPVLFEPGGALMVGRAAALAAELDLQSVILATGLEWRRPDLARRAGAPFIVPLDFPEAPKLPEEDDWQVMSHDLLRAWDHAPGNPAVLRRANCEIALTTHGLSKKTSFRPNLRLSLARGLSETDALAALTTVPARLLGAESELGAIESGKLAHLTVFENGDPFEEGARVREVWIDGIQFPSPLRDDKPKPAADPAAKPSPRSILTAARPNRDRGPLLSPSAVLVREATIWTCGPEGVLKKADLLVQGGKVRAVGKVANPPPDMHVIELPGVHVTPGLIDCHSHSMILGGVNEGTLPSTAMVRIGDVVNSETETIHQQLAGGLTVANLLHGSANPIGGQNCVIKLRDGAPPDRLKLRGAPEGIKFALGENVKQSNWGDSFRNRFPQSRMGVPAFHTNRFTAARQYQAEMERFNTAGGRPVRRDLELEALAEILDGSRLIHCHSYRQDEILAFLRVMEGFGVRIGTLQHILEGYKVADEIAAHGAGASAFSDWWAYKFEVFDAIPHAGAIMRERGVLVSFNSDSSDHARRMNLEAAKAVKYGGVPEPEALQFVTLNPAIQLGIDSRVGSLEPGKDGDFVIWSGHPLTTSSRCLQTWIDGRQYFEVEAARKRAADRETERQALIAKARASSSQGSGGADDEKAAAKFFWRALEDRQGHLCVDCCMDREMTWQN